MAIFTSTTADSTLGRTFALGYGDVFYGTAGVDKISIDGTANGVTVNGGGGADVITMAGTIASYTASADGTNLKLTNAVGSTWIPLLATASTLKFADNATGASILIDTTGTAPALKLGTQTVSATAAAITGLTSTGNTNEAPVDFTLTTAQDIKTGSAVGGNIFRAVAGTQNGLQDQTTLNSSDVIDGNIGPNNQMIVLLNGNYGGGAHIKNIQTLKIGTNTVVAAPGITFDYNVNAGQNEIQNVQTVVADQINTTGLGTEILSVINIVPTANNGTAVNAAIPTLSWENDATTSIAGTVNFGYRAATVAGTADIQNITLKNVTASNTVAASGVLNIAPGIETFNVTATGTSANTVDTLNTSANGTPSVANGGPNADLASVGTLKTVNVLGDGILGKSAGIITSGGNNGLTDHASNLPGSVGVVNIKGGTDLGISTGGTATNLVSVDDSVTTINASANTGGVNMRFNGAVNAVFTGSSANDYIEFGQPGNESANGGTGNDTFAFINSTTNSSFGNNDSIAGGTGVDTLQLGLNGAGTYNLSVTEFQNVTGVEQLDLRGMSSNVTLYQGMVGSTDASVFEVHTDRVIQSSLTNAQNPVAVQATNNLEKAAVNVVYMNQLAQNQAIKFFGGSGSDRLVLNNATFSNAAVLQGGETTSNPYDVATPTPYTVVNPGNGIGSGQYNTIVVADNAAIIDDQDLSNVSGFQGIFFSKPQTTAIATELIVLTNAFLTNNTQATDLPYTDINDTYFHIGTAKAGGGAALTSGDTVTIDLSNVSGTIATTRHLDVSSLTGGGVNVNYKYNGVTYTTWANLQANAAAAAVFPNAFVQADPNVMPAGAIALQATTGDLEVLMSCADVAPAIGNNLMVTDTSANTTSGWGVVGNQVTTTYADTINVGGLNMLNTAVLAGGAGVDTIIMTTGADISNAIFSSIEAANITGAVRVSQAEYAGFGAAITAPGAADSIFITTAGAVAGSAGTTGGNGFVETYLIGNVAGAGNGNSFTMGAGSFAQNLTDGNLAGSTNTVTFAAGAYTGTFTNFAAGDQMNLVTGTDISGVNAGANIGGVNLSIANNASVTVSADQWNTAAAPILGAAGVETVTLKFGAPAAVSAAAAASNVENYVLTATNATFTDQFTISESLNAALSDMLRNGMSVTCGNGVDKIIIDNAALLATNVAASTTTGVTIKGFDVNNDKINLSLAGAANNLTSGSFYNDITTSSLASGTVIVAGAIVELNANSLTFSAMNNTANLALSIASLIKGTGASLTNTAAGLPDVFIVYGGTNGNIAAIYEGTVTAGSVIGPLELVANIPGLLANSLTGSNFF